MSDSGNVLPFPPGETADGEAAAWLVRLDRGNLTDAERIALREWLAADARHVAALQANLSVWEDFDELARDLVLAGAPARRSDQRRPVAVFASITLGAIGLVATVLLAFMLFPDRPAADFELVLATELGEHRTVSLPDESEASLNSDTLARIEYTAERRQVHLLRGEARFQVAHDPDRPFAVLANGQLIEALGTAFVVRIEDDGETLISVSEGEVRVAEVSGANNAGDAFRASGAERHVLRSGEELLIAVERAEAEVRHYDPGAFQRRLAWTHGRMVFRSERLQDVIEEFARHSSVTIELSEPAFADLKVSGNFVLGDVDAFLEAIEITLDIQADRLSDDRVLLAAPVE